MIPKPGHPIVEGKQIDRYWYEALRRMADSSLSTGDVQGIVNEAISGITSTQTIVYGSASVLVTGDASNGYGVSLRPLNDSGTGTAIYKFTRDSFGRISGTESATTDDLPEGSSNLYYTDARVDARIALSGGVTLPIVNGETPPQLMYFDDGSLLYGKVE